MRTALWLTLVMLGAFVGWSVEPLEEVHDEHDEHDDDEEVPA